MGKGNRNSQKNILANEANSASKQKKASSTKGSDKAVVAALAFVALIMVTVLVASLLASNGVFIRAEAAMTSTNVEVDSAMMNFFYNNYLSTWYTNYSTYINAGYFSINPSVSLKSQTYGSGYEIYFLGSYTGTWYNYFLDTVMAEVQTYVIYAEGAIAAGISLDESDYAEIDTLIADIKATMKEAKASFGDWYGKGVKEKDVRRAYELVFLAEKFMEHKNAELEAALDADRSVTEKYVNDNKASFYTADVLKYTITTVSKNLENDAAFDEAKKAAAAEGAKIAAATSHEDFVKLIKAYEASKKTDSTTTDSKTDIKVSETDIEKYKSTITYSVSDTDELGKWLFDAATTVNATKVIEATAEKEETVKGTTQADGTKTEDKKIPYTEHTVTVYIVFEPMHLDKDLTKNAGYFISSDKAIVEQFLASIKDTVTTYEDFQKAGEDFYNAYHEGHDHSDTTKVEPTIMFEGIEELQDGYFPDSYKELGEWIDANDRVANTYSDIFTIKVDDKTTYYGFGYFEKFGEETWYVNGYAATLNHQFKTWVEDQKKATPVTPNNKALTGSITPLMYGTTATTEENHEGHDHE